MKSNVLKFSWCLLLFLVCLAEAYTAPYNAVTVFEPDSTYCYRIPSIVRTNNGTLLAFAEGREMDCSDMGDVDIVVKRSTNNGQSWGPTILIDSYGANRLHNPCPVVDKNTGRIYVIYCVNGSVIAYKYSTDNGSSWTNYTEIGSYPTDVDLTNGSIGTGPCNGIQLRSGPYEDRLVIPYRYRTTTGAKKIRLLYSDNGSTWNHSTGRLMSTGDYGINEVSVAEMANGDIYFNMRNIDSDANEDTSLRYRIVSWTTGDFFTNLDDYTPLELDTMLPEPTFQGNSGPVIGCQGSLLMLPNNHLVFANPAHKSSRRYLTIRSSFDEGGGWAHNKVLSTDYSAYSDMVYLENGYMGVLYETGSSNGTIAYSRFGLNWLTEPEIAVWTLEGTVGQIVQPGTTIFNRICYGFHGTVTGQMPYVAGPASGDEALRFGYTTTGDNSTSDYITVYDNTTNNGLDFDAGEKFEITACIKTSNHRSGGAASSGAIISKDSDSSPNQQWWLRVEDARIKFLILDDTGHQSYVTSSITIPSNSWVTVRACRDTVADQLKIYIDGTLRGTATDTTTTSLRNGANVRIGNFNNYARQFKGDISYLSILRYE
ncbi:MAG: hypothetical protein A2Y10_19825 [Planctomycetes bacterium GWF2_41_51]|nr:MAG: hypothetical protein A2Y10_19825 [Planctomycetes bacterium GWF2_41_51]HBG28534.1 hypothetical protein [Phycisphaerales bacterium]